MIVYHISQTLKEGDAMVRDHQRCMELSRPFIQALEYDKSCFYGMVLNAKYMFAVLKRFGLREWSDYAKWATEGLFEYVRQTEFPDCISRLNCNYFYTDLADSKKLYEMDWGEETDEERSKVHLFEVEVDENRIEKRDMSIYDEAYDAMSARQDMEKALECARKYYTGEHGDEPIWEYLYAGDAVAGRNITEVLGE